MSEEIEERRRVTLVSALTLMACSMGSIGYYVVIHTPQRAETLEKIYVLYRKANLCREDPSKPPELQSTWCGDCRVGEFGTMCASNSFEDDDELLIYIHPQGTQRARDEAAALAGAIQTYVKEELPDAKVRVHRGL